MTFIKQLESMDVCPEGMDWLKAAGYRTATEAWKNCPRADWMVWFAGKKGVDRKTLVTMACICARTALKYAPKGENRPRIAIETTEKWLRGEASLRDVEIAASAAGVGGAAASAAAAAYTAAYAAYAAHAAHTVYAAAYAACTYAASANASAKTKALKIMAEKIRKIYPVPPKRKGVK